MSLTKWLVSFLLVSVGSFAAFSTKAQRGQNLERHQIDSLLKVYSLNADPLVNARLAYILSDYYVYRNPDSARLLIYSGIRNAQKIDNQEILAGFYNDLGVVSQLKAQSDSAAIYFYKALQLYEELGDSAGISRGLNNCGYIYMMNGRLEEAEDFYRRSIAYKEALGNRASMALSVSNIGDIKMRQKNYDEAIEYFERALEIQKEVSGEEGLAYLYKHLGSGYNAKKQPRKAIEYIKKSIRIDEKYEDRPYYLAESYIELCNLLLDQGKVAEANTYAEKVPAINKDIQSLTLEVLYTEVMRKIRKRQGDESGALAFAEKEILLKDSASDVRFNDEVLKLQERYNSALKDRKIENLRQENSLKDQRIEYEELNRVVLIISISSAILIITLLLVVWIRQMNYTRKIRDKRNELLAKNEEIQKQNEKISSQRDEASNRNRVISHQNKYLLEMNELNKHVISVISRDIRGSVAGIFEELRALSAKQQEGGSVLDKVRYNSQQLLALIDNLVNWSRTQLSGEEPELAPVSLIPLVEEAMTFYQPLAEGKQISLLHKWLNEEVWIEAAPDLLKVVIQNILNNALKFTPRGGDVTIELGYAAESIAMLSIADSGVGMTQPQIEYIMEHPGEIVEAGTAGELGSGLGLVLVREFLNKIKGRLEITSEPGNGTIFTIFLTAIQPSQITKPQDSDTQE